MLGYTRLTVHAECARGSGARWEVGHGNDRASDAVIPQTKFVTFVIIIILRLSNLHRAVDVLLPTKC